MGNVSGFLLAKDINAALVAFACMMLTFLGIPGELLASVIVALVTLRKGYISGAVVLAFVALPAVGFLLHRQWSPFDFMFIECVLVWFLAILFRRYQSWTLNFDVMVLGSLVALLIFHWCVPNTGKFWMDLILSFAKDLSATTHMDVNLTELANAIQPFLPYLTGLILFSICTILFLELCVARRWELGIMRRPEVFAQEFTAIRMGYLTAGLLLLVVVGTVCGLSLARDALFILVLPFMFAGLSYVHYLAKKNRYMFFVLVAIYVGLFITYTSIGVVLLLAAIGFIDSLCNLRKRF